MRTLVLVDGPNLYNDIDRWLAARSVPEEIRRHYFHEWLDFDRIATATLAGNLDEPFGDGLGLVVFHSDKPLGSNASRLSSAALDSFWQRQGTQEHASAILVTVPGHQSETFATTCKNCDNQVQVESRSEKGVDTSIVTYLFESADHWDQAVLFTNDADFVPPVLALRRKGKRVFSAALDTPSTGALRRASQSFFAVPPEFLQSDLDLLRLLLPDGGLDRALNLLGAFSEPSNDAYVSTDQGACLTVSVNLAEHARGPFERELEPFSVTWFKKQARIGYGTRFQLGIPVRRHRSSFVGSRWPALFRE